MSNFSEIALVDLNLVTGGAGIDDPTAPSLSDLRSSNVGFDIGPPSSHIQSAPAPRPIGSPLSLPGGGVARF